MAVGDYTHPTWLQTQSMANAIALGLNIASLRIDTFRIDMLRLMDDPQEQTTHELPL